MRNKTKAQMRKQIREEIRSNVSAGVRKESLMKEVLILTDYEWFIVNTNALWQLDKQRNGRMNQIRSAISEKIIAKSSYYPEIQKRRLQENKLKNNKEALKKHKKETAKIIKKALKEQGWLDKPLTKKEREQSWKSITEERDIKLERDIPYHSLDIAKAELEKKLREFLETQPIYMNWLKYIRGIDILTSAKLLRIVKDIERFATPSALWHYFGLHVVDGKAPKLTHGKQATYSPRNRALAYLIAQNQKMQRGPFRPYYDNYKERDSKNHSDYRKFYLDSRAMRYCAKMFLLEFWIASYQAKGLEPPTKPYSARYHPNEPFFEPLVPYPQPY